MPEAARIEAASFKSSRRFTRFTILLICAHELGCASVTLIKVILLSPPHSYCHFFPFGREICGDGPPSVDKKINETIQIKALNAVVQLAELLRK